MCKVTSSGAQQRLVIGEQHLADLKDIILAVDNEVCHDYVEFAGVREGVHCLFQQGIRLV